MKHNLVCGGEIATSSYHEPKSVKLNSIQCLYCLLRRYHIDIKWTPDIHIQKQVL